MTDNAAPQQIVCEDALGFYRSLADILSAPVVFVGTLAELKELNDQEGLPHLSGGGPEPADSAI